MSCLALVLWLRHTVDAHLCVDFSLLRSYSRLAVLAAHRGWDCPLSFLDPRLASTLRDHVAQLCANRPVPLPSRDPDWSDDSAQYDAIVTCDASAVAWAAQIFFPASRTALLLRQDWVGKGVHVYRHSTVAEPSAALRALQWLEQQYPLMRRIALITDHMSIVSGQQRPDSHLGGFSANPFLNALFQHMHGGSIRAWHIPGDQNPVDAASRTRGAGPRIVATRCCNTTCLRLAELERPYRACG